MTRDDRRRRDDFVRDVLARTTGSACDRALEKLPDLADGHLAELDRQLVQAHLEHCASCRSVAVVLGWVDPLLPEMAELDPGPAFTAAVVRRTTGAEHPLTRAARRGATVGPAGVLDRVARWWQRQLTRPRFALEVAYVATVILVLLATVPGAPLQRPARLAGEVIQAGPTALPLVGLLTERGQALGERGEAFVRGEVDGVLSGLRQNRDARQHRAGPAAEAMIDHLEEAWARLRETQWSQTGYQLLEAGRDFDRAWDLWWYDDTAEEPALIGDTVKEQT